MTEQAEQYRRVAATFTATARAVPVDAWENPAPCEGWTARDVIGHLVGWMPGLLQAGAGITIADGPSVADDPVGAWLALDAALQVVLDDPSTPTTPFSHPQAGDHTLDVAIGMFFVPDVLVHTWDLGTATGQQVVLDEELCANMLAGMEPIEEMLVASGHYAPRVAVPADADVQTQLIAFTGRQP